MNKKISICLIRVFEKEFSCKKQKHTFYILLTYVDSILQVCAERHRFETLMDYFKNYEEFHIDFMVYRISCILKLLSRERSGSVVECLTRDREATGSSLTCVTALWSLSKTHLSWFSTGSTKEDPSQVPV